MESCLFKKQSSAGYSTLYGDLAGFLAPLAKYQIIKEKLLEN